MKGLAVSVTINASQEVIWQAICDIDGAADRISGIEKVEVLERPQEGFLGFKWRETRTMFGQTATEVMWITDVLEGTSYTTRAESHGAIYKSHLSIEKLEEGGCSLTMEFSAEIVSLKSKIISALTGWLFAGATKKALKQDLLDIKSSVEGSS